MYFVNRLKKVAKKVAVGEKKLSFTVVNKAGARQDLEKFAITLGKEQVAVVIEDPTRSTKYKMTSEFSGKLK
jgi:hypothetical protein